MENGRSESKSPTLEPAAIIHDSSPASTPAPLKPYHFESAQSVTAQSVVATGVTPESGKSLGRSKSQTTLGKAFHYPTRNPSQPLPRLPPLLVAAEDHPTHSLRDSTNTVSTLATSNSSLPSAPATPLRTSQLANSFSASPNLTPRTAARNAFEIAQEQDRTAALINKLYSRLEKQGVEGDGWEVGKERSRDGIINRDSVELSLAQDLKGKRRELSDEAPLGIGGELSAKEENILKRVDRYGFFSESHPAALACQHNRLATLSRAPFYELPPTPSRFALKSSTSRRPSSSRPPRDRSASTTSLNPSLTPEMMALESKRISKWSEMLQVASRDSGGNAEEWRLAGGWWDKKEGSGYRKYQRRVFKGIPDRWRRAVWGLQMEHYTGEMSKEKRMTLAQILLEYRELLETPSNQDIQIDLDVPRTISGNVLFHTRYGHGQRALFHVLHAFGLHCESFGGYCQGMGPIAATFLSYFEPERAFACMVRLFDQYNIRHIFEPGFPGLVEAFYVQERLVEQLMPEVHTAFATHGISSSSYATKWYITLFSNSVPFSTQLRLWDGLLLEGVDFLIFTAVAIIWSFRHQFTASNASFESILSSLSSYFLIESEDSLLRWIRKVLRREDLRRNIIAWRGEWKGFVLDGSADRRTT